MSGETQKEQSWVAALPIAGKRDAYKTVILRAKDEAHALTVLGYSRYGRIFVDFDSEEQIDSYDDIGDYSDEIPLEPAQGKPLWLQKYDGGKTELCQLPDDFKFCEGLRITNTDQIGKITAMPTIKTDSVDSTATPDAAVVQKKNTFLGTASSMLGNDLKDGALRASSRQATKFVRGLLLDKAVPKIDNALFRAGATSFLKSVWGGTAIKLVGGYGYALMESRIPMKPEFKAYASVISEHLRRDGISNVLEEVVDAVAIPVREFIKGELESMSAEDVETIMEKNRVRIALEESGASPAAIEEAEAAVVTAAAKKPRTRAAGV